MGNYTKTALMEHDRTQLLYLYPDEISINVDKAPIQATLYTIDATATLHIPYLLFEQAALSRLNSH